MQDVRSWVAALSFLLRCFAGCCWMLLDAAANGQEGVAEKQGFVAVVSLEILLRPPEQTVIIQIKSGRPV